jgi:hypothetical protein
MQFSKVLRALLLASTLAASSAAITATGVLAYGAADQPLAQIEVSGNCLDPSFPLCAPPPASFGVGGFWLWIEIDQGGTADVAGAFCGHGNVTPGAFPIRGEFPWVSFSGSLADLQAAFPGTLAVGKDPGDNYYVLPEFGAAFPQTDGHYAVKLANRVFIQSQVAP